MAITPYPYDVRTDSGTFPDGVAGTGTVTIAAGNLNIVQGTGTLFTTEITASKNTKDTYWIYLPASKQLAMVIGVSSDTTLRLDSNLTAVAGVAYTIVRKAFRKIHVQNVAGPVTLNGKPIVAAQVDLKFIGPHGKMLVPMKYDASGGGSIAVETQI